MHSDICFEFVSKTKEALNQAKNTQNPRVYGHSPLILYRIINNKTSFPSDIIPDFIQEIIDK